MKEMVTRGESLGGWGGRAGLAVLEVFGVF